MLQYNMQLFYPTRYSLLTALSLFCLLLSVIIPQQGFAYSKKSKSHYLDSLRHADSIARLVKVNITDTIKIKLRTLESVQLDSVEALILIGDAHWSVKRYDKAGLFIRAAFAQYAKITPQAEEFPLQRYEAIYASLVSKYKEFLSVQAVLPPETPLEVLLQEDTDHLKVPPDIKAKVDSLFRLTTKEATKFNKFFEEYRKQERTTFDKRLSTQVELPPVPVVTNKRVENALSFFLTRGSGVYQRWLDRAGKMMPVVLPILKEEGIPEELFCLAMIESGLNPNALSRSHAAGIYQFISSTGEIYGLQTGWWYDERRNPEKATRAACKYLRKLYRDFDDWYLAMGGYNCGEGRIARTLKRDHTRDYWRMKSLPRETRNYIPTYLAALILFQEPERWGFKPPQIEKPWLSDTIDVDGVVDLAIASRILGISVDELKWRNPELVQFCTDPINEKSLLRVPRGMGKLLTDSLAKMTQDQKIKWVQHTVRKGETLRSISRKYGLPEKAIADLPWNSEGVRRKKTVIVGSTLRFPLPVDKPIEVSMKL